MGSVHITEGCRAGRFCRGYASVSGSTRLEYLQIADETRKNRSKKLLGTRSKVKRDRERLRNWGRKVVEGRKKPTGKRGT